MSLFYTNINTLHPFDHCRIMACYQSHLVLLSSSQAHYDVLHRSKRGHPPVLQPHQHTATAGPGHRATPAPCCLMSSYSLMHSHGQAEPNSP